MIFKLSGIVLLFALLTVPSNGLAQIPGFTTQSPDEKFNPELIPASAFTAAALFPKRLSENSHFKYLPYEVITAWGRTEFGFDPMLLKQITWVMTAPPSLNHETPPAWALILHFDKLQGLSENLIGKLEQKSIGGKTIYSAANPDFQPSFLVYDDSTIVIGTERLFESMLTADGNNDLIRLCRSNNIAGQALAFVDIATIRGLLNELISEAEKSFELPPALVDLKRLPELLKAIEIGMETDGNFETTIVMHAVNEAGAEQVSEILAEAAMFLKRTLLTEMSKQMDLNDPVQTATIQYTNRVWEKYEAKLTPKIKGADLTIVMHEEILAAPFLMSFLGISAQQELFREKATPQLQLKETALAFHNYTDAYGKFPGATINDGDGRPLFSGRVAMLPFLEQMNLYNLLRLDEPWDSPHNSQFTSITVPVFRDQTGTSGMVRFPVYPNSIWDEEKPATGFADLRDGTSNTILAIMASDEGTTSWADPKPWRISTSNPMQDVFGNRDEVHVAMADGSVQLLKKSEMTN